MVSLSVNIWSALQYELWGFNLPCSTCSTNSIPSATSARQIDSCKSWDWRTFLGQLKKILSWPVPDRRIVLLYKHHLGNSIQCYEIVLLLIFCLGASYRINQPCGTLTLSTTEKDDVFIWLISTIKATWRKMS